MHWYARVQKYSAKTDFKIASAINVTNTGGLVRPPDDKTGFVLNWVDPSTRRPPELIIWGWDALTGEFRIATGGQHAYFIRDNFDRWLRGFYFPAQKLVVMRPFFWKEDPYDDFDRKFSNFICDQLKSMMIPKMEPGVRFEMNVDNNWLRQNSTGTGVSRVTW